MSLLSETFYIRQIHSVELNLQQAVCCETF